MSDKEVRRTIMNRPKRIACRISLVFFLFALDIIISRCFPNSRIREIVSRCLFLIYLILLLNVLWLLATGTVGWISKNTSRKGSFRQLGTSSLQGSARIADLQKAFLFLVYIAVASFLYLLGVFIRDIVSFVHSSSCSPRFFLSNVMPHAIIGMPLLALSLTLFIRRSFYAWLLLMLLISFSFPTYFVLRRYGIYYQQAFPIMDVVLFAAWVFTTLTAYAVRTPYAQFVEGFGPWEVVRGAPSRYRFPKVGFKFLVVLILFSITFVAKRMVPAGSIEAIVSAIHLILSVVLFYLLVTVLADLILKAAKNQKPHHLLDDGETSE